MTSDLELIVTRRFDAPAELVFDAWLDANHAGRWWFATADGEMQRVEIDPRVGGSFLIVEKRGDVLAEHIGKFIEIDRPRRLVFSYVTNGETTPTTVTIDIQAVEGGCELTLRHSIPPKWAHYSEKVRAGWTMILDGLARTLTEVAS